MDNKRNITFPHKHKGTTQENSLKKNRHFVNYTRANEYRHRRRNVSCSVYRITYKKSLRAMLVVWRVRSASYKGPSGPESSFSGQGGSPEARIRTNFRLESICIDEKNPDGAGRSEELMSGRETDRP